MFIDFKILFLNFLEPAWSDISSLYDEKTYLSSYIWTKYIFETHILVESGQDYRECGVRCELSGSQCDFFLISTSNCNPKCCHLGRYSYWNLGTVVDSTNRYTYHKNCKYFYVGYMK